MSKPFKELLAEKLVYKIPKKELKALPSGYQRIGDILIVHLRAKIAEYKSLIGETILRLVPHVRTVCQKTGGISGAMRLPEIEVIAGDPNTVTVHKENGCLFKLDVSEVMFAKGNITERARIPQEVGENETVVDLFAGIGYFSIPIAVLAKPTRIYSIELNPTSFKFLKDNIKINEVEDIVTPLLGDCRDHAVRLADVADRVIMGYLPATYEFLPAAFRALSKHGGIIHYHDVFHESEIFQRPIEILEEHAGEAGYQVERVLTKREVKSYAPRELHVVLDVEFAESNTH
ncbi:MAG: class I SAM-dependent methyltransferase [Promethearchaeia archaeon]